MAGLASRQHGVVTLAQLRQAGLTPGHVRGWVQRGHLHPIHRGVFVVGYLNMDRDARLLAALYAIGRSAFLSHRTAAAILGLRPQLREIELTVPGTGGRTRPGLTIHRTRRDPTRDELRTTRGLRHSSFARVLCELARRETEVELTRIVEEGVRRRLFFLGKVEAAIELHRKAPGIQKLERPLAVYIDRSDRTSALERAFDRELQARPSLPPPERNVMLAAGGIVWEIDCLWREQRVIVELDGRPWHICERDFEKDRLKDTKLSVLGFTPIRVTGRRFDRDPVGVFDDIEAILRQDRAAA